MFLFKHSTYLLTGVKRCNRKSIQYELINFNWMFICFIDYFPYSLCIICQIRSLFRSVFSHILNTGKYGPEKSPYLDTSRSGLRLRAETYSEPSRIMKTWLFEELFSQKASSWIFNWVLDKPMAWELLLIPFQQSGSHFKTAL